jgi:phage terminase large subunit-like protein
VTYGFEIPGYDPEATAPEGYYFDEECALRAVQFFTLFCTHVKGELAGQPFELEPWQQCVVWHAFGWKKPDGTRRYQAVWKYVPRKNGKSTFCAGLALLGLTEDEPGAEVYSLGADREQAALVFNQAKVMTLKDEVLSSMLKAFKYSITYPEHNSSYKALSADADTKHGFNTHFAVIDEVHAQPDRDLIDVIDTSTGSRRQPMIWYITTADFSRESICNEMHDYARQVRDGIIDDPTFLPIIFEADVDDDWEDPEIWAKANPNLGVSVKLSYIEKQCRKAKANPAFENTFKRLHLNVRTEQDKRWIQMEGHDEKKGWKDCGSIPTEEQLLRSPCWGGLDLSSTTDLSSFALYWPEFCACKVWFWLPEARLKTKKGKLSYQNWVNSGHICLTPGNVIDYEYIRKEINDQWDHYNLQDAGADPWNATHILTQLSETDGREMLAFRQGYASMNEPSKELEKVIINGSFQHGNNPVLTWMASNVSVQEDPAGNIKPIKPSKDSPLKVDGIVAVIIALGRAHVSFEEMGSVYEERGIIEL